MLDISIELLGITVVVFLALIALLNSLLIKPMFAYMEKRDADISKDLNEVGSNDSEIDLLHKQAEKIMMDAKLEAVALREKVIVDAKELAQSKLEAKRAELASEYVEFTQTLAKEKEGLKVALLSQLPLYKEALKAKLSKI